MKHLKKINLYFLLTVIILLSSPSFSNESTPFGLPLIENYSSKDFKTSLQNWAIIQDNRGIMYFGSNDGVLEYDSKSWRLIPLSNYSAVRSFAKDSAGRIFVGGTKEFGYLDVSSAGETFYVSLSDRLVEKEFESVWKTFLLDKAIYYFAGREKIFKYATDSLIEIILPAGFKNFRGFLFQGEIYVFDNHFGLAKIRNDSLISLDALHDLGKKNVYSINAISHDKILVGTRQQGFFLINSGSLNADRLVYESYNNPFNEFFKDAQIYSSSRLKNGNFVITTLRGGLAIFNKEGKPLKILDEKKEILSNTIYCSYEDLEGNIWLGTEEGISKIEMHSPIRFFNESNGLQGTLITLQDFNHNIYIGTSSGIFYLNKKNKSLLNDGILPLSTEHIYNLDYEIIYSPDSSRKSLLASSLRRIVEINVNNEVRDIINLYGCYSIVSDSKNKRVFLGHPRGINVLEVEFSAQSKAKVNYLDKGLIPNFKENIRFLSLSKEGDLWISTAFNGIFLMQFHNDFSDYSLYHYDTSKGVPSLNANQAKIIDGTLYLATLNGIYILEDEKTSPENYKFIPETRFGLETYDDSLSITQIQKRNGDYWLGTHKGMLKISFDKTGNPIIVDTPFKRTKDISVEAIYIDHENQVWYGARSDLYSFDPYYQKDYDFKYETYIRRILINNDSVFYHGGNKLVNSNLQTDRVIEFSYKHNSIKLEFAAPFFQNEYDNRYSYKLEGYDNDWSDWVSENKVTYTNLYEGNYKFMVKARNIFDVESSIATFEFIVTPPWYRSVIAYVFYIIIAFIIIYLSVRYYTRKLAQEKKKLEKIIYYRTREIEQQKEEIKAQSDQLVITNKELERLSLVAKKTNNAVVIIDKDGYFEWINDGFKRLYEYEFDEFVKVISPNIKTASNDEKINKTIQKCFDDKIPVHYEFHAVTKSGKEVYVQTSLTPILDENGDIHKVVAIDSDISDLKRAEKEIIKQQEILKEQAEKLEISNRELEKLSIIARETDNAVSILDAEGKYQWINEGYTRMYGYTLEQLQKEKDRHSIGENSNIDLNELAGIWFGKKKAIIYESLAEKRDGSRIWTQTTLTPILSQDKSIKMLIAIDSDITRLKEAESKIEAQKAEIEAQRDLAISQRDEISTQKQEIIDSIVYAKRIQNAVFPSKSHIDKILQEYFILYKPRDIVSGDFYWFAQKDDVKIVAVVDCTGHGVPGAFMSLIGVTFLKEIIISNKKLIASDILFNLRKSVIESLQQTGKDGESRDGMDISIIIINEEKNYVQYSGANNPLFLIRDKQLYEYKADKMPISMHRLVDQPFTNHVMQTRKNDIIYLFTDGYSDQFGGMKGKKFKVHNFKNLLLSISDLDINEQKTILDKNFEEWKGRLEQVDDILVVGVKL